MRGKCLAFWGWHDDRGGVPYGMPRDERITIIISSVFFCFCGPEFFFSLKPPPPLCISHWLMMAPRVGPKSHQWRALMFQLVRSDSLVLLKIFSPRHRASNRTTITSWSTNDLVDDDDTQWMVAVLGHVHFITRFWSISSAQQWNRYSVRCRRGLNEKVAINSTLDLAGRDHIIRTLHWVHVPLQPWDLQFSRWSNIEIKYTRDPLVCLGQKEQFYSWTNIKIIIDAEIGGEEEEGKESDVDCCRILIRLWSHYT